MVVDDLCTHPLWRAEDLGKPLPDSPHAVSVAMPLWEHVVGYEEEDPSVVSALHLGYPRFFIHPLVRGLFDRCTERFAQPDESCFAFPTLAAAERCREYVRERTHADVRIEPYGYDGIHAVVLPREAVATARSFWQHGGEVVSSRLAEAAIQERDAGAAGASAKRTIQERVAHWLDEIPENVYLFPTGMAGIYAAQRAILHRKPEAKTIQFGFPYVDLLKTQQQWGPGVHLIPHVSGVYFDELETALKQEEFGAVYAEFPGNPLLECADLERLSSLCRSRNVPLIVDDTLATSVNVNVRPFADVVVTSLTKLFSGAGDVAAGAVTLNGTSPFFGELAESFEREYDDALWGEDAVVLEANSRDYAERVHKINETTETLYDELASHGAVKQIHYPKGRDVNNYDRAKRADGGYGPLFSLETAGGLEAAKTFYNTLRVSKGPSLGTNFTLACPYMLLAHYKELEWAERLGVPRHLVRVSVGLEEPGDLVERFKEALGSR